MTADVVKNYIINELNSEPRHNCKALAYAFNEVSNRTNIDARKLIK